MTSHDKHEVDAHSGTSTTGHEWDGIKELDTPLPRWWLFVFYATIAAAVLYWVLMPAWPLVNGYTKGVLGQSDRRNVAGELLALQNARGANFAKLMSVSEESVLADPQLREFARAAGATAFNDNCRTCHGAGGAGAPGFPSLADDVWIWGGTLADIEQTITHGVRADSDETRTSQMPAYGRDGLLPAETIADVTEYVLTLGPAAARTKPNAVAAARGAATFQEQCASCHGADGSGARALGAPSLKDDIWLYGGSREEVQKQIELGRGGVMPHWNKRFDAAHIRALAIYVYALGGGEKAEAPTIAPTSAITDPAGAPLQQPR